MRKYRGSDLPDIYFERMETVYVEMMTYFEKAYRNHGYAIALNAINQAYIMMWLASFNGDFDELEEEIEDTMSTFKANVYNVIDSILNPEEQE